MVVSVSNKDVPIIGNSDSPRVIETRLVGMPIRISRAGLRSGSGLGVG